MKAREGFSLLEVLVATLIMGIAITGLVVGLSQSVRNASRLSEYDRAAILARTQMNELLLDSTLPFDGKAAGAFDANHGWNAVLKPFDAPPTAGPGSLILQQIALQIWWNADSHRRTLELTGYRQTRIPLPVTQ